MKLNRGLAASAAPSPASKKLARRIIALATGIASLLALENGALAETIDTFPAWNGATFISSWGVTNTATYGQTFTLTDRRKLDSLTFSLSHTSGATPSYQAFIYQYNGSTITGSALFTSPVLVAPSANTFTNVTVNTNGLKLESGVQYVAFFTTSTITGQANGAYRWGALPNDTTYPGGLFVFQNNGANFANLFTVNWSTISQDLAFRFLLSPVELINPLGNTLMGPTTIDATLINYGTVNTGPTGSFNVQGDFTQMPSGDLVLELKSKNQFGHLDVDGVASLSGAFTAKAVGGYVPKAGQKFTFLNADGGVSGTFDTIKSQQYTFGTILGTDLIYGANTVTLEITQGSFADFASAYGLTFNQREVAQALDHAIDDGKGKKVVTFLNGEQLNKLPGEFDRIAPEELTSIFTISTALAQVQSLNLQRRTDDLRSGSTGFSASRFSVNSQTPSYSGTFGLASGAAGPTGDGKESKAVYTPAPDNKWGVFLSGVGEWIDVDGDGNARGYDISTGGFTLGVDYKVTPNFAVGISAGYAGTSADLTNDGRVWVNGGKLGVYATYFTGGFYTDFAVNGGYNSYDTKRSALHGTARGDTEGGELNVLFGTGYDWQIGALKIGPTATFNYTLVGVDGFDEHGSLAPLRIGDQTQESIRTAFGFKASFDWKIGGVTIRPEIRAAWQHEFGDDTYSLDSSFADGAVFTTNGPDLGRDSVLLGGGFAIQINDRVATYFYYDGELGRSNYESHSVSGGVRIAF